MPRLGLFILLLLALVSCKSVKLAEGEHFLGKVNMESTEQVPVSQLKPYLRQASSRSFLDVILNRKKKSVFDAKKTEASRHDFVAILNNNGYMQAVVDIDTVLNDKNEMNVTYRIKPGKQLIVSDFRMDIDDKHMDSLLRKNNALPNPSDIKNKPFDATMLNNERKRITDFLLDKGYTRFNQDFISVDADTIEGDNHVWLTMKIAKYRANRDMLPIDHPQYRIGKITYKTIPSKYSKHVFIGDSIIEPPLFLRESVVQNNTMFEEGKLFRQTDLQNTYNRFGRLNAVRSTQINLQERPDERITDVEIRLLQNPVNSVSFMPEGTNTAGNLGAAASLTYSNRNIFHGSETFSVQLRGAFEAIKGLEGYSDSNYMELGIETKLEFPRLLAPFIKKSFKRNQLASSELSLNFNTQNRPEFHRRVFRATWRYRWQSKSKSHSYVFDLLDLNFISMPWISETFKSTYLDSGSKKNAILRYNYQDLFIMKTGIILSYKSSHEAFRVAIEESGNLMSAIARLAKAPINSNGQRTVLNNAYAQYVKFDFDYTKIYTVAPKTDIALHANLGIAYPYGNSKVLPFEKRYFSGGPNSVRGWSVRGLGPGHFRSTDGAIDFINQTGDLKLDLNAEFRAPLFWKLGYAIFIDAGNIWTLRNYTDQPNGQFHFKNILRDLAVSYGLGVRLNFDYFILRLDCGIKAINPAYESDNDHWAIIHPNLKRDFALHFAVGLPF